MTQARCMVRRGRFEHDQMPGAGIGDLAEGIIGLIGLVDEAALRRVRGRRAPERQLAALGRHE